MEYERTLLRVWCAVSSASFGAGVMDYYHFAGTGRPEGMRVFCDDGQPHDPPVGWPVGPRGVKPDVWEAVL